MQLATVDLPPLGRLRDRWAAVAAVAGALGFPDTAHARDSDAGRLWRIEDGVGNWAHVWVSAPDLPAPDRAVLYGWDRLSRSRLSRRADGEPTGELLTDAPDWWPVPLRVLDPDTVVGFVLGWDGAGWLRVASDLPDGSARAGLPISDDELYGIVDSRTEGAADEQGLGDWRAPWPAVARLGVVGPALERADLAAVLGPLRADLPAGIRAARAFAGPEDQASTK